MASSQGCRQRAERKNLPSKKEPGPPHSTDSLSPDDVHSEAKCILHSVGLALWGRDAGGSATTEASVGQPSARLGLLPGLSGPRSSQAPPQLYLGQLDGFIELVQGTLEVRNLWGTAGSAWSVLLGLSFCHPTAPAWPLGDLLEGKKLRRELVPAKPTALCSTSNRSAPWWEVHYASSVPRNEGYMGDTPSLWQGGVRGCRNNKQRDHLPYPVREGTPTASY